MSSFSLQQVECPKCHGTLNATKPFSGIRTCAYCHTEFEVTGNMSKQTDSPERLVPFHVTKDQFEQAAFEALINADYTPQNIFELTSFDDIEGIYMPMFLYEGKFDASWSCQIGQYENEVRVSGDTIKNKQVLRYRPHSGTTKGNYAFLCLAYEGPEARPELVDYSRTYVYNAHLSKAFDANDLDGYNFLIHNLDKETTWSRFGESTLKYQGERECERQIPGEHWKDLRCNISAEPKHDGRLAFVPFWMVYYKYDNENHYIIMDGTGTNGPVGSTPVDHDRVKAVESPYKIAKMIGWGALALFVILWFTVNFSVGFYTGLVLLLGFFGMKIYAGMNKKKIINTARDERWAKFNALQ